VAKVRSGSSGPPGEAGAEEAGDADGVGTEISPSEEGAFVHAPTSAAAVAMNTATLIKRIELLLPGKP